MSRLFPKTRHRLVVLLALVAGGSVFAGLWFLMPPRPRLTLRAPVQQQLVGFSADGSKLLTLSWRMAEDEQWGTVDECGFSGPVHFWDLRTGECETGQSFRRSGRVLVPGAKGTCRGMSLLGPQCCGKKRTLKRLPSRPPAK